jgi:subtilisin family serine protease
VEVWHVDIISMSFGYESMIEPIDDALKFAGDNNVLLIAAASNVGGNTARARRWPSERDNVIPIRAAEGRGCEWDGNPPPNDYTYNFATLGVMVPVWSIPNENNRSQQTFRTGTSIATPIAAAVAASVFELVRNTERMYIDQCTQSERSNSQRRIDRLKRALSQASGMCKVFLMMSEKTGRFDYVQPTNLLGMNMTPEKLLEQIMDRLKI